MKDTPEDKAWRHGYKAGFDRGSAQAEIRGAEGFKARALAVIKDIDCGAVDSSCLACEISNAIEALPATESKMGGEV